METQVSTTKTKALATAPVHTANEEVITSDLKIPKIHLLQATSELVHKKKAAVGDIVKLTTGQKLGNEDGAIEIIPLTFINTWVNSELVGKKFEHRGVEARTAKTSDLPWEYEKNGTKWRRDKAVDMLVLLPSEIEQELKEIARAKKEGDMPDLEKALTPWVVTFKRTSFRSVDPLLQHFNKAQKFQVGAYVNTFMLGCRQVSNDKGTYYVYEVEAGGKTKKEYMQLAADWYNAVTTRRVIIEDTDLDGHAPIDMGAELNEEEAQY